MSAGAAPAVVELPREELAPGSRAVGTTNDPFVPYACDALPRSSNALVAAHPIAERLLELSPIGQLGVPFPASLGRALDEAMAVPLDELSLRDRILLQSVALNAASKGGERARVAAALARRVALDAATLRGLGSDPRGELEPWIGSAEGWVERRGPSCGSLGAHDGAYEGALAFRTIRSGRMRVLFAQIVALDSALGPHVTPLIGLVELRTGMDADASACVLEAGATGLGALTFDALPTSPFVRRQGTGKVGCSSCHSGRSPADLADLGREEGGAFRVERRLALLERARARADALFSPDAR